VASLDLFHRDIIKVDTVLDEASFNDLIRELNVLSIKYYNKGHAQTITAHRQNPDLEVEVGTFIEIDMIRDSMTPDKRNVININQSLSLTMMNSLSDAVLNNINNETLDYRQFLNFKEFDDTDAFAHFIQDRSNAVLYANNHYVTILKISGFFFVIESIPCFSIHAYSSLNELMLDLNEFVRGSMIVLCHARLFGQTELDCIVIDDDDDDDVSEEQQKPDADIPISRQFTETLAVIRVPHRRVILMTIRMAT
jgi:hypothetical protein